MVDIFPSWEVVRGPAPIDWCEANYAQSGSVAELNNTITNAAYVVATAALIKRSLGERQPIKLQSCERLVFIFYCSALLLTGLTSGLFHATLIWVAQKADEIFENWTVLTLFHSSFPSLSCKDMLSKRILPHAVFVALGIWLVPVLFCEVHLVLISLATVYRYATCLNLGKSREHREALFKTAAYAIVGFGCWLCDMFACKTFSSYYLHAYGWHILTALALYEAGCLLLWTLGSRAAREAKQ